MSLRSIRRLFSGRSEKESPTVLLISGFGWSGSGAVIDFALDFPGVETFRKRAEETSLLKGRYSLGAIYRRALRREPVPMQEVEEIATVLRGLPGSADAVEPRREYINLKRNEQMRQEFGAERVDATIDRFVSECRRLTDRSGERFTGAPRDVMRLGRRLTAELGAISVEVNMKAEPGHIIVNNDPAGYSMDLFGFHDNARYTVVTRDLRDVFADLVALKRVEASEAGARRFSAAQGKKLERFTKARGASPKSLLTRTFVVDFADFVSSEDVRRCWLEFASINGDRRSGKFDPQVSMKNVGIGGGLSEPVREIIWQKAESVRRDIFNGIRSY